MLQLRQFLNMAYIFQMNEQTSADMNMWFDYTYGIINMVCMFVASSLAARFDKKKVLVVGLLLIVVGLASCCLYITPKYPYLQLLLAVLTAPGMSCVWVLTNSCIADVCDYDELQTGLRREGFYGAVYAFFMKLGSALGLGLGGLILYLVGFDKELTAQSAETILRFRVVFALVPAAVFAAAVVLALKYPITKQKLLAVQQQLAQRREQI
jgi:GPH family glycoside/pentoside/hexuronide:cation symporter